MVKHISYATPIAPQLEYVLDTDNDEVIDAHNMPARFSSGYAAAAAAVEQFKPDSMSDSLCKSISLIGESEQWLVDWNEVH